MMYYAQRKSILNGVPQTPNNRYGTQPEMERQFHLYCASACTNTENFELDLIEWGTLENGALEQKVYIHQVEPTPEVEPEE